MEKGEDRVYSTVTGAKISVEGCLTEIARLKAEVERLQSLLRDVQAALYESGVVEKAFAVAKVVDDLDAYVHKAPSP